MADYCTTADVKAYTDVIYTDLDKDLASATFDTMIGTIITNRTAQINAYCNRDFDHHTSQTDIYSIGPVNRREFIANGPITTLTSVETRGDKSGDWATLDSDYYTYETPGVNNPASRADVVIFIKTGFGMNELNFISRRRQASFRTAMGMRSRALWIRGYENVRVKGNYGFTSVPTAIKNICIRLVDMELHERVRTSTTKVVPFEDPTIENAYRPYQSIPPEIQAELDLWKSVKITGIVI